MCLLTKTIEKGWSYYTFDFGCKFYKHKKRKIPSAFICGVLYTVCEPCHTLLVETMNLHCLWIRAYLFVLVLVHFILSMHDSQAMINGC